MLASRNAGAIETASTGVTFDLMPLACHRTLRREFGLADVFVRIIVRDD